MKLKLLPIIALSFVTMFVSVDVVNAQDSFKKQEFAATYTHKRTDFAEVDDPTNLFPSTNGFTASYTRNVSRYVGIKGEFAAGFTSGKITTEIPPLVGGCYMCTPYLTIGTGGKGGVESFGIATSVWDIDAREMSYIGGLQFKDNGSDKKITPFAHVLGGVMRQNAKVKADGDFFNDYVQNSFTMVFGGGVDFKVTDGFSIRAIQFDYNPVFSKAGNLLDSTKAQHTFRISTGVVFH